MSFEQGEGLHDPVAIVKNAWAESVMPSISPQNQEYALDVLKWTIEQYGQEGRYYHTAAHIADCITKLEPYKERDDYQTLLLALLWHDVEYRTDENAYLNETQSATFAAGFMLDLGLDGVEDVGRLVLATKGHKAEWEDEQLICGIDLSILGAEPAVYLHYAQCIREEYAQVPMHVYALVRAGILERLCEAGGPFQHPDFHDLNSQAVENMKNEISYLRQFVAE